MKESGTINQGSVGEGCLGNGGCQVNKFVNTITLIVVTDTSYFLFW